MQYFKTVLKYKNKKFWLMILLSLIPALVLGFGFAPSKIVTFVCRYRYMDLSSIDAIARGMLRIGWWTAPALIGGAILSAVSLSLLFGAVNRHMRVGDFVISKEDTKNRLNFNIITALMFVGTAILILTIAVGLFLLLAYMFTFINSTVGALIATIIVMLVLGFLVFWAFSFIILWPPIMLYSGLNSNKAFNLNVRSLQHKVLKITIALLIPSLPMFAIMMVNSFLQLYIGYILDVIMFVIMICFYVVLMYSVYYEIEGIERADLNKVSLWKKSK